MTGPDRPSEADGDQEIEDSSAELAPLDKGEVDLLREVGRHWKGAVAEPDEWKRALPIEPLNEYPEEVTALRATPSLGSSFVGASLTASGRPGICFITSAKFA